MAVVAGCALFVAAPAAAQTNIGTNIAATNLNDLVPLGSASVPPDTMGAVGPNHVVQIINGAYRVLNKDGSAASTLVTDSQFWQNGGLTNVASLSDPRVIFDPLSSRWLAVEITTNEVTNNRILVGRSNTANPLGGWKAAVFTTSNNLFADYPTLGADANGVYVGANNFPAAGAQTNVGIYSFPKADLLLATPSIANRTAFPNEALSTRGFTVQPVLNYNLGQTTGTAAQMLAVDNELFSRLNVTPLTGAAAAGAALGTSSDIVVGTTSFPTTGKQPNAANTAQSTFTLDSLDDRIGGNAVRVGNNTFMVHGIGVSGRAALRVTVLNATTNALVAEATLSETSFDSYIGSIAANANGDVVVGYTRSGFVSSGNATNRFPSAYASVGTLTGTTLTFGSPIELQAGLAEYSGLGGETNPRRWGDYSATLLDPADPGIFWTTQEYSIAAGNWGTRVAELIPTVATEVRWRAAAAGAFATPANWFNAAVPGANGHAVFSRNGDGATTYTVSFAADATNARASVRQGLVAFSIPAATTYTLTSGAEAAPSLAIAEYLGTARLTVSGGGALSTVTTTIAAGRNGEGVGNASSGSLAVTGAGTAWLNSGNAYLGGSDLRAGGVGALAVDGGASGTVAGTLKIWKDNGTTPVVTVGAAGSAGTLLLGGLTNDAGATPVVSLANAAGVLRITDGLGTSFGGTVTGPGAVEKQGAGTFTLTGTGNTYAGTTSVSAGILRVNGVISGAGGTVTVSGGRLEGNGNLLTAGVINRAVQVNAAGELSGGNSVGQLKVNGDVAVGGTLFAEVTGATADLVDVTGNVTLTGGTLTLPGSNTYNASTTYTLLSFSGTRTGTFATVTGLPASHTLTYAANGVQLVPVPEPAAVLGLAAAALGLGRFVRRRAAGRKPGYTEVGA
jgi:autotransporter-associated beta strand protein